MPIIIRLAVLTSHAILAAVPTLQQALANPGTAIFYAPLFLLFKNTQNWMFNAGAVGHFLTAILI